jgi:hypothetical protein
MVSNFELFLIIIYSVIMIAIIGTGIIAAIAALFNKK